MASLFGLLNRLLPFATEGTPLLVDLVHLFVLCAALYFAPQIQDRLQQRSVNNQDIDDTSGQDEELQPNLIVEENQPDDAVPNGEIEDRGIPRDTGLVPADDNEHEDPRQRWLANEDLDDGEPGPADMRDNPAQRNVGAKKAKSLARRDQRRAYNEFMRSQGEAQRAQDAEGAEERERALAAERERRKAAEAALNAKKTREREKRREQERKEREEENSRREATVELVRNALEHQKMCNLFDVAKQVGGNADEVWVEKILSASGLLKNSDGLMTMITTTGWVVQVSADHMARAYALAVSSSAVGTNGIITHEQLGLVLESMMKSDATY